MLFRSIILEKPILAAKGDRFVIRFYSPATTIGGGTVLGIASYKRKRFKDAVLEELHLRAKGSTREMLINILHPPLSISEVVKVSGFGKEEVEQQLTELKEDDLVIVLQEDNTQLFWLKSSAEKWGQSVAAEILKHQNKYPLRRDRKSVV